MLKLKFNKIFKEEDSRFLLGCGFRFVSIFLIVLAFIYYAVWMSLSFNHLYFESVGFFTGIEYRQAFFDNALTMIYNQLPAIGGGLIIIFFIGVYVGKALLRPFEIISKYCEKRTLGESADYNPDIFSDYKLLTRFSEFFFRFIDECMQNKKLIKNSIPPNFSKIHNPQFEKVFFFHFLLFIIIVSIVSSTFLSYFISEIQSQIINLSLTSFKSTGKEIAYFLDKQRPILESITTVSIAFLISSYIILAFHLYSKVSGAIFGFFATMRSFMKGNTKARVHLIGFAQIRPHGRTFNKYMDYVERECEKDIK